MSIDIDQIKLAHGGHSRPEVVTADAELCFNEWVAYLAGEPHSAEPKCASRVIVTFTTRWQDSMNDEDRQILRPYLRRVIGTAAGPEIERKRAYMAADWSSRTAVPKWLRACGATDEAAKLEALAPVVDEATARTASIALRAARDVAYKLRDQRRRESGAAGDAEAAGAAWDAEAAGAAGDAEAAWAAGAAWDAGDAGDALIEKLRAANAKTYDEVYSIARPYFDELYEKLAAENLRPVVVELQRSALDLVDRMIAVGTETQP